MTQESLTAVEVRMALARLSGKHHHCGESSDQKQRRAAYETTGQSRHRSDQTEFEGTDGLDGEKVPLILRHNGPPNSTGRERNEDIVGE